MLIKTILKERGVSIQQFQNKFNISWDTAKKYSENKFPQGVLILKEISEWLEIPVEELIEDIYNSNKKNSIKKLDKK